MLGKAVNRFTGQTADAVVIAQLLEVHLGDREWGRLFVGLTRPRLQTVLVIMRAERTPEGVVATERAAQVLRAWLGE
jgi:hypothetical protein